MSNEKDTARYAEGFVLVEGWVVAVLADPAAPPSAAIVYLALGSFVNNSDRTAYPSKAALAKRANVSTDTVDRAISYLSAAGVITVAVRPVEGGRHQPNLYTLHRHQRGEGGTRAPQEGGTGAAQWGAPVPPELDTEELDTSPAPVTRETLERPVDNPPGGDFSQLLEAIVTISTRQAAQQTTIRDRNAFATTIRTAYAPEAAAKWQRWRDMFPEAPVELMAACIVDGSTRPLAPYYRSPDA